MENCSNLINCRRGLDQYSLDMREEKNERVCTYVLYVLYTKKIRCS